MPTEAHATPTIELAPTSNKPILPIKTASVTDLSLCIDRITIVGNETDQVLRKEIIGAAYSLAASKDEFTVLPKSNKPYTHNLTKLYGPSKAKVFLQIGPTGGKPLFRMDLNPAKLGPDGIAELRADLAGCLPDGVDWLLAKGHTTRIDAALDLMGADLDQLHVVSAYPMQHTLWSREGRLQTIYMGTPKSQRRIRLYDKAAEQSGGKCVAGPPVTRIEAVIRKSCLLSHMKSLPNPFSSLKIIEMPPVAGGIQPHHWFMFGQTAKNLTVGVALAQLPSATRNRYRKALASGAVDWFKSSDVWALWPATVEAMGLFKPQWAMKVAA